MKMVVGVKNLGKKKFPPPPPPSINNDRSLSVLSSEIPKILICTNTAYIGIALVYIHELVVRVRQLASVAQLVRALYRNRTAAGSIPAREPSVSFFATVPG